jgi:hypothetical protein
MSTTADGAIAPGTAPSPYITAIYAELCHSYQALHDFRTKLLRLLPIASIVGLVALGKALPSSPNPELQPEVVGYIGIFSGIFTLALFGYEIRSLLMCHDYSLTGAHLEATMGVAGQFTRCNETRPFACYDGRVKRRLARFVNDRVTSSLVYSFVFAAWFFVGLRYALSIDTHKCVFWAFGIGAAVAATAILSLGGFTAQQPKGSLTLADVGVTLGN